MTKVATRKSTIFEWRLWQRVDSKITFMLFVLGAAIGGWTAINEPAPEFYQKTMPSIVVEACGKGMREPAEAIPSLLSFLDGETPRFDCSDLDHVTAFVDPNASFYSRFYLAWAVSLSWKALGPTQANIWPVLALLHGLTASASFALVRQFFGRGWSCLVALILSTSPITIAFLAWPRDYSTAPFFLWALTILFIAMRASRQIKFLVGALLVGLTIGFGAGFRVDLLIALPVAAAALLVGGNVPQLGVVGRALAIGALTLGFALPTYPIFSHANGGGGLGAMALEGASQPFLHYMGVTPALYDVGYRYSDELTIGGIAADLRATNPTDYDARELANQPFRSQALLQSTGYFLKRYALYFPADVLLRATKSIYITSDIYMIASNGLRS
jgi:hypothetical protein